MANKHMRESMIKKFGAVVAEPELSGDNALGIAILGAMSYEVSNG